MTEVEDVFLAVAQCEVMLLETDVERCSHLELHTLDRPLLELVRAPSLAFRAGRCFRIEPFELRMDGQCV